MCIRAHTQNLRINVIHHYHGSTLHDDLLFVTQLLVGFFALMRLGELTLPDDTSLHKPSKVSKRTSVHLNADSFQFFLPQHKADRFFEGNVIVCLKKPYADVDVFSHFFQYLTSRDRLFPFSSPLWLTSTGPLAPSLATSSFYVGFTFSLTLTSLVNLYVLGEPRTLPSVAHLPLSFKHPVVGLLTLSAFTYKKTLFYFKRSCMSIPIPLSLTYFHFFLLSPYCIFYTSLPNKKTQFIWFWQ